MFRQDWSAIHIHAIPGFPFSRNVTLTLQSNMKLVSVASRGFSWKSGVGMYDWIASFTAAGATFIVMKPVDGAQICGLDMCAIVANGSDAVTVHSNEAGTKRPELRTTVSNSGHLDVEAVVNSGSDRTENER